MGVKARNYAGKRRRRAEKAGEKERCTDRC